jgi:hypothetical protein
MLNPAANERFGADVTPMVHGTSDRTGGVFSNPLCLRQCVTDAKKRDCAGSFVAVAACFQLNGSEISPQFVR